MFLPLAAMNMYTLFIIYQRSPVKFLASVKNKHLHRMNKKAETFFSFSLFLQTLFYKFLTQRVFYYFW